MSPWTIWCRRPYARSTGFFVNDEHATFSDEKTRIRLRLNTDYIQHHGFDISPKVKLHLVLPGMNDRLRLVMNDDQGADVDQASPTTPRTISPCAGSAGRAPSAATASTWGSASRAASLDPFGRVNLGFEYDLPGKWVGQTTNRLYYYSKTGLRNDFRQYFNRGLTDDLLLRSRTRVQYFEENDENPYIEQKFSLFHSLSDTRKLAYEVLYRKVSVEDSPFDEDEIINRGNGYLQPLPAAGSLPPAGLAALVLRRVLADRRLAGGTQLRHGARSPDPPRGQSGGKRRPAAG